MSWKHKLPMGAPRPLSGERKGAYMARAGGQVERLKRAEEALALNKRIEAQVAAQTRRMTGERDI